MARSVHFRLQAVLIVMCALSIFAAAQTPPSPAATSKPPLANEPKVAAPASPVMALPLAVSDELDVNVSSMAEMTSHQRVNDEGNIHLPYVGYVHVAGLTSQQAEDLIATRLRDGGFVKDPQVSIFVKQYSTSGISIFGEVNHPGIYPSAGPRRLWDVMLSAGGTTSVAGSKVIIRRKGVAEPITVTIANDPDKALESNVEVLPGDTLMVPRAGVVYVLGEVYQSAGYILDTGDSMTVLQALAKAKGPTNSASLSHASVLRKTPAGVKQIGINVKDILHAKAQDMNLINDDILFIPGSRGKYATTHTIDTILSIATGVAIRTY